MLQSAIFEFTRKSSVPNRKSEVQQITTTMAGQVSIKDGKNTNPDPLEEVDSFHKELLKAGKAFEQGKKPAGTYRSNWHTSVDDQTMTDPDGKTTYICKHKTEMTSSYSHTQGNGCIIQ
ncbi:hypothetical protein EGW08_007888 [Elysia chlorotica]|uniref:Uncharacterized protein n=1 Tax=Elysia chlorotica TaxID=188477 RepID=A0A433TS97_ELYCH|nr:hypothetical protein EGW08_007888 [Elysia chlorotica]